MNKLYRQPFCRTRNYHGLGALALLLLISGCGNSAPAQLAGSGVMPPPAVQPSPSNPGMPAEDGTTTAATTLPAATFSDTVSEELALTMEDGVQLAATVTFPSLDGTTRAPGKFPAVVSITPYSRNGLNSSPDRTTFATRGIIGVTVDTRGTGGSGGNLDENYFSPLEARDSAAVIEYFGTQDYSSGKIGMAGGSYVGITQLLAAAQQPPHLAAIVPQVVLSDLYRDGFAHGGIQNLSFDLQYIGVQGGPGIAGGNTSPELLQLTVLGKIQQLTGTPIAFDYLERPNDDDFYRDRSPIYQAAKIQVPVLLLGGWRDGLSQRGAIEMYHVLAQRPNVETRLYMDPCTHKGCGAPFAALNNPPGQDNLAAVQFEFLSKYLLGTPTPRRSPVRLYVQAGNRYLNDTQWPPRTNNFNKLYLDRGALVADVPAPASESYFTNPSAGLSMSFDQYGTVAASPYLPTDQRLEGEQGLTFRTPILAEPLLLAGPSVLHLRARSTASDTDWIVKLADVDASGAETIISNGYLRASHRALDAVRSREGTPYHTHVDPTPIKPDELIDYEIEIWPTAYELAVGHRLQVRLTSQDVPTHSPAVTRFDRNDPAATQIMPLMPATNTVEEGGSGGSYLLLPVQQ